MSPYRSIFSSGGSSGGYRSIFGGAGVATPAAIAPPEEEGKSIGGFVGNVFGGLYGIAKGLGGLVVGGATDLGKLGGEVLTLGGADFDYSTPELAQNITGWDFLAGGKPVESAVLQDFKHRYGMLLPGGRPASEILDTFYEEPVSYGLDALAVASGGTTIAAKAGAAAVKGTPFAARAASVTDDLVSAGVRARTANAAGIRTGLEELAVSRGQAPGVLSKLLPQSRPVVAEGMGLVPSAEAYNPLARAVISPIRRYGMTEDLSKVRARVSEIDEEIRAMPGDDSLVATKASLERMISAAESAGLSRVETPRFQRINVNLASRRMIADLKSRALNLRERESAKAVATAERYIAEDPTLRDRGVDVVQGLDIELEGPDYTPIDELVKGPSGLPLRLYHGTSKTFDEFDPETFEKTSLYGPGIYMTEDSRIAGGYAAGPDFDNPTPLTVELNFSPVEGVDVDTQIRDYIAQRVGDPVELVETRPIRPDDPPTRTEGPGAGQGYEAHVYERDLPEGSVRAIFRRTAQPQIRGGFARLRNPLDIDAPLPAGSLERIREGAASVLDENELAAIDPLVAKIQQIPMASTPTGWKVPTGEDVWKAFSLTFGEKRATEILEASGFDGITHIGGKLSGNPPHQVYIAFHPEQVVGGFHPPPPKMTPLEKAQWAKRQELRGERRIQMPGRPERTVDEIVPDTAAGILDDLPAPGEVAEIPLARLSELLEGDENLGRARASLDAGEYPTIDEHYQMAESMKAEGFYPDEPLQIYLNPDGTVDLGNGAHRFLAAEEAGLETIPIKRMGTATAPPRPIEAPAVFGDALSPEEATRAAAVVPGLAERTEAVSSRIESFIERMETDRAKLSEGGWDVDAEIDGARRANRGLADGLRRAIAHSEPNTPEIDPAIRLADEMRLNEFEELADGFESGGLTPGQALDRAYRPLRAKYGLDVDPETPGAFVGGPDLAELDDAIHAAGEAQPVYVPHIDATRLRTSDFFTSSRPTGANIYARDPHNEQMKLVLLKRGTILKDPVDIAKRRGARSVRESETFHLWDRLTRETGIPITDASQVPRGYRVVAPDQLFIHYRSRAQMLDEIDRQLVNGAEPDAAIATATRKVMEANQAAVEELMESGAVKMYAVPEVVLKNLDSAARWGPAFGGKNVRLFWDTPMNSWRALALTASPRWIVNNVLGNIVFGAMQGVKTADVLRIFGEKYRTMLGNWLRRRTGRPGKEVRESSLAGQVQRLPGAEDIGHGYVGNVVEQYVPRLGPDAENTAFGRAIMRSRESRPMIAARRAGEAMKHLNGVIEDSFREASFLTAIEKAQGKSAITRTARSFWSGKARIESIMENGLTPQRARLALKTVDQTFGRYGNLSPFERHVVRRWLFPFWGFYKHQLQLLMRFPLEMPGRASVAAGLGKANEEMLEQYGPVPEWLEGALPLGPPGSDVTFLTTRGADPFSGTFQPPTAMLAPPVKTILEQSLGRSLFTGEEFSDPNVVQPFGSDQHFRIVRDENGIATGVIPVGAPRPGIGTHLLQQIPQFNLLAPVIAGGKAYDTAPLTAIPDPETGEPLFPTTTLDQLARFGGYSTIDYDLASYQERLARDAQAALTSARNRGPF